MNFLKFTTDKLSVGEISDLVYSDSCGAVSTFIGTTRDNFDGKRVISLEYEAYESMGLKCFENICKDIRKQWQSVENIAIYHRLGKVPVKEASIVIAISSPHRNDAIKATEMCINSVKSSAPIWKKEIYEDSEATWKENKESITCPPKSKKFDSMLEQPIQMASVPPHLEQIKITNVDLEKRIEKCMELKREELDIINIREFCHSEGQEDHSCARIDAVLVKRKGSKSHLEVRKILNNYQYRDCNSLEELMKYIPQNGVDERLENLESQLSLSTPAPKNIYHRIRLLEQRMLYLESVSPEYIHLWEKCGISRPRKKKIFSIEEIDELIADLENKKASKKQKFS